MKKKHSNIPVFISQEGCPNDCIFCNQKKISGALKIPSLYEARSIIDKHLESISSEVEIAFFGGTFTGLPLEIQNNYLGLAKEYYDVGKINGIRLSTRPDYINKDILKNLKNYPVRTIELGIQSFSDDVLENSQRGYNSNTAVSACKLVKEYDFSLGVQTMIGLPFDSYEKAINTALRAIEIKADMVRIYPTLVISETKLLEMYKKGEYKPLSLETAVNWCANIVKLYQKENINILRIGLQNSDEIQKDHAVIEGPVHPSFGELVYSKVYLDSFIENFENNPPKEGDSITINAPLKDLSKAIGHNKNNVKEIIKRYKLKEFKIKGIDILN